MIVKLDKLTEEWDISQWDYEKRVDLFNKFQINQTNKALSPLKYLASLFHRDIYSNSYINTGYSHGGAILSGMKKEDFKDYGINIEFTKITYKVWTDTYFVIHLNGNMAIKEQKNEKWFKTQFYNGSLIEIATKRQQLWEKGINFLKYFNLIS